MGGKEGLEEMFSEREEMRKEGRFAEVGKGGEEHSLSRGGGVNGKGNREEGEGGGRRTCWGMGVEQGKWKKDLLAQEEICAI